MSKEIIKIQKEKPEGHGNKNAPILKGKISVLTIKEKITGDGGVRTLESGKKEEGTMKRLRKAALKALRGPAGAVAFAIAIAKAESLSGQSQDYYHVKEGQGVESISENKSEEEIRYSIDKFYDFSALKEGESVYNSDIISPFGGPDAFIHNGKVIFDMSKSGKYGYTAEIPVENKRHQAAIQEFTLDGIENAKFGDHNPVFVSVDNAGGDAAKAQRIGTFVDLLDKRTGYIQVTGKTFGTKEKNNDTELFPYSLSEELKNGQSYAFTIETYLDKMPWLTIVESRVYLVSEGKYKLIGELTITLPPEFKGSGGTTIQTPVPGNAMFGSVFVGSDWKANISRVYTADRAKGKEK